MHPVNLVVFDFDCVAQAITGENINLITQRECNGNLKAKGQQRRETF